MTIFSQYYVFFQKQKATHQSLHRQPTHTTPPISNQTIKQFQIQKKGIISLNLISPISPFLLSTSIAIIVLSNHLFVATMCPHRPNPSSIFHAGHRKQPPPTTPLCCSGATTSTTTQKN